MSKEVNHHCILCLDAKNRFSSDFFFFFKLSFTCTNVYTLSCKCFGVDVVGNNRVNMMYLLFEPND